MILMARLKNPRQSTSLLRLSYRISKFVRKLIRRPWSGQRSRPRLRIRLREDRF